MANVELSRDIALFWRDITNGMQQLSGHRVITDPAADQILSNIASDGRCAWDRKSYGASGKSCRDASAPSFTHASSGEQ
jgi:hypothetical protein